MIRGYIPWFSMPNKETRYGKSNTRTTNLIYCGYYPYAMRRGDNER